MAICAIIIKRENARVAKIKKGQNPIRKEGRDTGVVIDCDEITISVFPPPREHGKAHCHVRAKKSRKVKGKGKEVFPELKVYLDGSEPDIIVEGFSERDIEVIGDIIFNEPEEGQISNDEYLEKKWEELHNGES